jgi:hypothetical protein
VKIALLVVGILIIFIGLIVSGISIRLHLANPRNISFNEAMPAIIGGCCCSSLGLVIGAGGLIWMVVAPKKE